MPEFYHVPALSEPLEGKPRLFVATPATQIYGNHMASVVGSLPFLMLGGMSVEYYMLTGLCHVDDARNVCVGAFLQSKAEWLIFIDADVGFPAQALYRLAMHKGDIVAGAYPRKEPLRSWPVKFEDGATPSEDEDGVVRQGVLGLPTGFMKIHRRVLEAMAELDHRRFNAFGGAPGTPDAPVIFERDFRDGDRMSGDYTFCQRAKLLGFELALDPHLPFTHAGEHRFGGCLIEDWRAAQQQAALAAEGIQ